MDRTLKNKIVVVTGGASGIGFEIADQFLKKESKSVIILDINEDIGIQAADVLAKKYGTEAVDFYKCDVTHNLEAISKTVLEKYKTIDVLVNNAGIMNELTPRKTIEVNATSVIEWTLKFWEHMRTDKGGKGGTILNMSSIYGFRINPYVPIYKASKHAVFGFTKTFGHEQNFKKFGVRVAAICPGFTRTTIADENSIAYDKAMKEDLIEFMKSPERMWQDAVDVGKAAVDVFQKADSGTAWLVEGGLPISQVEDNS